MKKKTNYIYPTNLETLTSYHTSPKITVNQSVDVSKISESVADSVYHRSR